MVKVPRFYINTQEWLDVNDVINLKNMDTPGYILRTLPVNPQNSSALFQISTQGLTENSFVAALGHNYKDKSDGYTLMQSNYSPIIQDDAQQYSIINADIDYTTGKSNPDLDGFSISRFNGLNISSEGYIQLGTEFDGSVAGSLVVGTYYDMVNAPNLSLTMSREYGPTKETKTYNGSSISNTMANKQPMWGDKLGAWELHDPPGEVYFAPLDIIIETGGPVPTSWAFLSRSGRRVWRLKWSHLDSGSLWGPNQLYGGFYSDTLGDGWGYHPFNAGSSPSAYDDDGDIHTNSGYFNTNILTDHNFFAQVWNRTNGGTIPFIFSEDKDNTNPDNFAICKIKENSLKATMTSPSLYDISLTIEEVW